MGGEITDHGLPQTEEEEVRYEGDGKIGYWVALNESDDHAGRKRHTFLEVHTVTTWNVALWRVTDGPFRDWASGWYRRSAYK